MNFWPLFGITRLLTEKRVTVAHPAVTPLPRTFRRSLHLYAIDVGNSHALNLELHAMKTAQYNIHRHGIFFSDTPRHADLLLILGAPLAALRDHLRETLLQMPRPFGVLWLLDPPPVVVDERLRAETAEAITENGGVLIAGPIVPSDPEEIVAILRSAMKDGRNR